MNNKYLKYKKKYLDLKYRTALGGGVTFIDKLLPDMVTMYNELNTPEHAKYIEYKDTYDLSKILKKSNLIGKGSSNSIYKYDDETVLLKSNIPITIDDIILFLYLNEVNDQNPVSGPFFTPLKKIIFTRDKIYLTFEKFTSDLLSYLCKLYDKDDNMESIKTKIQRIEDIIDKLFNKLLEINYICVDIRLENILINYNEDSLEISNIVLHDFDMFYCCKINDSNPDCNIDANINTKVYLMYLYKIIIYISFLMIIVNKYDTSSMETFFNIYIPYKKYIADSLVFNESLETNPLLGTNNLFGSFINYILKQKTSLQKKMFERFMYLFDFLNEYDKIPLFNTYDGIPLFNKILIIFLLLKLAHNTTFDEITEKDEKLYEKFISNSEENPCKSTAASEDKYIIV